jgi:hypothetical protein
MQIIHPFQGSLQEYNEQLRDPDRYRPRDCPQCETREPLEAHGFYTRSLVMEDFDGLLRIRRYLCEWCGRTISLLPEFVLPYIRFAVPIVGRFLRARLTEGRTLLESAHLAGQPAMAYQRGQHWVRRFQEQAPSLVLSLSGWIRPLPASDFIQQALNMLEAAGWIPSHRFLLAELRAHLLGWPRFLAPDGRDCRFIRHRSSSPTRPHSICLVKRGREP